MRFILIFIIMLVFASCADFKKSLDLSGLKDIYQSMQKDFNPGSPEDLSDYIARFNILISTNTFDLSSIKITNLDRWFLESPDKQKLIMRKITFTSCLKKSDGENDTAVFYLYSHNGLKNRHVILWIPGFGVSDFAFQFIKKFFNEELMHDYDILFYNIPFHLERVEKGKKPGEGYFSADTKKNIEITEAALYEIRTAVAYLKNEGVKSIGGWGGSIGAALLLLESSYEKFDHMTVMIPVVDWNTIVFNPSLKEIIKKSGEHGFSEELIRSAYDKISPLNYKTLVDPPRIQILYARYDQLTPESKILEFADKWSITNIHGYDESHGSILINDEMFRDYASFLDFIGSSDK